MNVSEAISGFYLSQVAFFLINSGIAGRLRSGDCLSAICADKGADEELISKLLSFVRKYPEFDILLNTDDTNDSLDSFKREAAIFNLRQYVGAYGPCLMSLEAISRSPLAGSDILDKAQMAAAYESDELENVSLIEILRDLRPQRLLDLAFGGGGILRTLARENQTFVGVGFDTNRHNVSSAEVRSAKEALADRITLIHGNFTHLISEISISAFPFGPDIVLAANVLNSFCCDRSFDNLKSVVKQLKFRFPGTLLVVNDYYPLLNQQGAYAAGNEPTLLQDVAQTVSAQGLPPSSLSDWQILYDECSCRLIHEFELPSPGLNAFVHLVNL